MSLRLWERRMNNCTRLFRGRGAGLIYGTLATMDNLTAGTSNSSCSEAKGAGVRVLVSVIHAATFLVSLPWNCLSVYVATLHVKRGYEIGVYLLNLICVDILYTLTLPYWLCRDMDGCGGWALQDMIEVVTYGSMYTSPAFLCCIAADRYLAIVHPLRFHRLRTVRAAVAVSAACWLLQMALHTLLLHWLGIFSGPRSVGLPLEASDARVYLLRFAASFCLPFSFFLFCSQRIYKAVAGSVGVEDAEKRKIAKLLLLLLLVYAVSFGPFQFISLARGVAEPGNCPFAQLVIGPYKVSFAWTGMNCAADPILYCWLSDTARQDIVHLTTILKHRLLDPCTPPKHHAHQSPKHHAHQSPKHHAHQSPKQPPHLPL
ncbi:G-protein coupled receptor 65-like [Rhinoraja longicauda]